MPECIRYRQYSTLHHSGSQLASKQRHGSATLHRQILNENLYRHKKKRTTHTDIATVKNYAMPVSNLCTVVHIMQMFSFVPSHPA